MGTTAQKLTYLNDTKTLLKYGINSIGGNITSQTTFRDYATQLENIYQNLPKVSGSGTNINLSPTKVGRITSQINGDTFQQTYTGKNLLNVPNLYSVTTWQETNIELEPGNYVMSCSEITTNVEVGTASLCMFYHEDNTYDQIYFYHSNKLATITITNKTTKVRIYSSSNYNNSNGKTTTFTNLMIEKGSTATEYEPFVGGQASPNPDYTQEIQSVTGNQTISVKGSNIFDNSVGGTAGQYLNDSGNVSTGYVTLNYSDYIVIPENETKLYVSGMDNDLMNAPAICFYDSNKIFISGERYNSRATATINIPTNAKYFRTSYRTNYTNFMIQTLDMYDINLGTIELNKIGNYQDRIFKTNGKNLINTVETNKSVNSSGNIANPSTSYLGIENYVNVEPNTTYSVTFEHDVSSANLYVGSRDKNGDFISRTGYSTNRTFTTDSNTYYVFFYLNKSGVTFNTIGGYVQLEKGSTPTEYEPYGTDEWYIGKKIGKVVLDGSETWNYNDVNQVFVTPDLVEYLRSGFVPYSNYYQGQDVTQYNQLEANHISFLQSTTNNRLLIKNLNYTGVTAFKTWLSTHNTTVYYVLATPTYEEITNETLITQLENWYYAMSKNGQTNISVDGSLPAILDVSALKGES